MLFLFSKEFLMFIFTKKRFALILSCLAVSFSFCLASNNTNNRTFDVTQVSAIPANNKVVVLDAGHGGEDGGAVSSSGISESEINLKIALKLQTLLEQSGTTVILTRSDENAIYEIDSQTLSQKKVSDIKNRVKIGNESSANIFVSIHLNKIPETQYDGWQTFYNVNSSNRKTSCRKYTGFFNRNN